MFPRKPHWISVLIAISCICPSLAAEKDKLPYPKLVVGIHIDQLESDYLKWFMEGFCEDGFKKLLEEGCVYPQVSYNIARKDAACTVASIACACPPRYHGIVAETLFDKQQKTLHSCMADANYLGNYTQDRFSPKAIKTSTVADELKMATNYKAKVFSIGLDAEPSIISGGQHADGVFWRDNQSGFWCSSTYYPSIPRWVENINDFQLRNKSIEQSIWRPKWPLSKYTYMPHQKASLLFHYSMANISNMAERVKIFKHTPMANSELCQLAIDLMGLERLGQDNVPDLLNLHFNLGQNLSGDQSHSAIEIQDLYFRLDEDIARLLKEIDKKIGLDKVLVYVVGTGETQYPLNEDAPSFYPDRCATLLNMYLGAKYGSKQWVEGYSDTEIYLDKALIQENGLDYEQLCRDAAIFLTDVEGVEQVFVGQDFNFRNNPHDAYQNAHYAPRSGDLSIRLQQGRNIQWNAYPHFNKQLRYHKEHTMLIFYGNDTPQQIINTEVSLFDIAPTLCRRLYIRPPTANIGRILP